MRIARYSLAGLLIVLLVASVAYDLWNERPYVVTGHELVDERFTVDYTLPGGGIGQRRFDNTDANSLICYFEQVEVGEPLPECLRSVRLAHDEFGPRQSN